MNERVKTRINALEERNKIYSGALIELYQDATVLAAEDVRGLILKAFGMERNCSTCWNSNFHRDPDSVCDDCENFSQWQVHFMDIQK